jgi:hypothetical protein
MYDTKYLIPSLGAWIVVVPLKLFSLYPIQHIVCLISKRCVLIHPQTSIPLYSTRVFEFGFTTQFPPMHPRSNLDRWFAHWSFYMPFIGPKLLWSDGYQRLDSPPCIRAVPRSWLPLLLFLEASGLIHRLSRKAGLPLVDSRCGSHMCMCPLRCLASWSARELQPLTKVSILQVSTSG